MSDSKTRELRTVVHVPADECPFCGGKMEGGKEPSTVDGPGEYFYRCDTCGAGDNGIDAFVDGFMDDADHPFDTPRSVTAQWDVTEKAAQELREPYRTEALEGIAEQQGGAA